MILLTYCAYKTVALQNLHVGKKKLKFKLNEINIYKKNI